MFFSHVSFELSLKNFREMHVIFSFGPCYEISIVKLCSDSLSILQQNMHLSKLLMRSVAEL